jgi:hypothetical protein
MFHEGRENVKRSPRTAAHRGNWRVNLSTFVMWFRMQSSIMGEVNVKMVVVHQGGAKTCAQGEVSEECAPYLEQTSHMNNHKRILCFDVLLRKSSF